MKPLSRTTRNARAAPPVRDLRARMCGVGEIRQLARYRLPPDTLVIIYRTALKPAFTRRTAAVPGGTALSPPIRAPRLAPDITPPRRTTVAAIR